jgi:hypothetical protein
MNKSYKAALVMIATLSAPVMAENNSTTFNHKDWEVVCDNTLTCRAAGYSKEEEASGSVLLVRKAGADAPLVVDVVLAEMESDETAPQSNWFCGLMTKRSVKLSRRTRYLAVVSRANSGADRGSKRQRQSRI